ncbi:MULTISPECIES: metal ABC transporter ATP-binding protein [Clostridium]|jgi:zinc transport system ATP-binding protein|uniref:metal ABC transporter ATP-binding protein n=1 Tax=Clostridium TaxID=1485 RepID=UPI0022E1931B|nr:MULTISPECIES: metal ABC transporter ATP-binding protein [Clostridium]MBD9275395.1 metal ABC transporter ATP-binding protein [Clostridium sp.]
MKIVDVDHLSFEYGNRRVLHNLNFSIRQGDYAVLTGENGSGKSTLMKVLSGELESAKGRVVIAGSDSLTAALHRIRIGYMPQNGTSRNAFFPATVEEIMETGMYHPFWKKWAVKDKKERICRTLEEMGMKDALNRRIGELSGGQQQRVMLARVLISKPQLLLLDEPAVGMDQESLRQLAAVLKRRNQEEAMTIFLITHGNQAVFSGANRFFKMEEGGVEEK